MQRTGTGPIVRFTPLADIARLVISFLAARLCGVADGDQEK
jgi:phage terminase large subunit-like protein